MEAPLWILILYSGVGAIDILYNHLYRYRLYAHASSFTEHVSHTAMTVNLLATVVLLVFVEMGTLGFALFLIIQAVNVLNTLWDVFLEPKSRAPLGAFPGTSIFCTRSFFSYMGSFSGR